MNNKNNMNHNSNKNTNTNTTTTTTPVFTHLISFIHNPQPFGTYYYDDDNDDNDGDKRFMYWLKHAPHSTSDPIMYQTSRRRATQLGLERDSFRGSSAYTAQRSANKAFFAQQKASNPQAFNSRSNKVSSQRSTYQQKQMSRIEASRSPREFGASYGNIRAGS